MNRQAQAVVSEKTHGSRGERLPHTLRATLLNGPDRGAVFVLDGHAAVGSVVDVSYYPDDQFARVLEARDRSSEHDDDIGHEGCGGIE